MLTIIHSGQTGVERGAHRAALSTGLGVSGFMPRGARDELGSLPPSVRAHLEQHADAGPRRAVLANLALASGILIVVPEADIAMRFVAMRQVIKAAQATSGRLMICDPATDSARVVAWTHTLVADASGMVSVMVHGPRGTRWAHGERVAWQLVGAIGLA